LERLENLKQRRILMKVTLPKTDLHRAIKTVLPFVPSRGNHPLARKVLAEAGDGRLTVTAQGDNSARFSVLATVESGGTAILDPNVIERIAHQTEMGPVTIKTQRSTLQITTSTGSFKLQTEAPDTFPAWRSDAVSGDLVVPRADFVLALKRTLFAADEYSARFTLGCVRIELADGELSVACCDGRRIAHHRIPLREGKFSLPLIGASGWKQLLRAMPDGDEEVTLTASDAALHFVTGDLSVRLGATEGRWPEWRAVVAKARAGAATVSTTPASELLRAVRLASIAASEGGAAELFLDGATGSVACNGAGSSTVTFPVACWSGPPARIELAPQFLVEWLVSLAPSDAPVSVSLSGPDESAYLTSGDSGYLVAPMSNE
jgi:DNA polymerase III sliding clamp (beta) subunit (PCNA family)